MFKGLWLWIRGLFGLGATVEETPKLSKESIDRVGKIIEEIKREAISVHKTEVNVVPRAGIVANFDHAGNLLSVGADHDGHMEPAQRTFHSGVEMSFVAEPGIDSKLLIERLNDPKPVPVSLSELGSDTPVPAQRKPRRRGKRGGRGRNKNKK